MIVYAELGFYLLLGPLFALLLLANKFVLQAALALVLVSGAVLASRCTELRSELALSHPVAPEVLDRLSRSELVMNHRDLRSLLFYHDNVPLAAYESAIDRGNRDVLQQIALNRFTPREVIARLEQSELPRIREFAADWLRDRQDERRVRGS